VLFRWLALTVLLATLGISAYFRRRARVEREVIPRGREGGVWLGARMLAGLALLATILGHILAPGSIAWASFSPPAWLPWIGVALGAATVPLAHWVFASIGPNVSETVLTKRDHQLVTSGPYRWVRHPLYATASMLLLALALMLASWLLLLCVLLAVVLVRVFVIPVEERFLVEKFGDDYRAYMRRTGRLLPRVTIGHGLSLH
jgi:protein-S-isoprenylcysteine O-methyltransferase Ste14